MYDLAVYLPGGALVLVILRWALENFFGPDFRLPITISSADQIGLAVRGVIWLSASYLAGHLAAFASTYFIEKLIHNNLGYPSEVWLELENSGVADSGVSQKLRDIFSEKLRQRPRNFVNKMITFAQLPAILPIFVFLIIKPFGFYSPKLPYKLLPDLQEKYRKIGLSVEIKPGSKWEKVLEHHVSNNCGIAYSRMYNYLVIYGALRLLSFILLMMLWSIIFVDINKALCFGAVFDLKRFFFLIGLSFAYATSLMAFAKFNRRYFEETVMATLLYKEKE